MPNLVMLLPFVFELSSKNHRGGGQNDPPPPGRRLIRRHTNGVRRQPTGGRLPHPTPSPSPHSHSTLTLTENVGDPRPATTPPTGGRAADGHSSKPGHGVPPAGGGRVATVTSRGSEPGDGASFTGGRAAHNHIGVRTRNPAHRRQNGNDHITREGVARNRETEPAQRRQSGRQPHHGRSGSEPGEEPTHRRHNGRPSHQGAGTLEPGHGTSITGGRRSYHGAGTRQIGHRRGGRSQLTAVIRSQRSHHGAGTRSSAPAANRKTVTSWEEGRGPEPGDGARSPEAERQVTSREEEEGDRNWETGPAHLRQSSRRSQHGRKGEGPEPGDGAHSPKTERQKITAREEVTSRQAKIFTLQRGSRSLEMKSDTLAAEWRWAATTSTEHG